MKAYEHTRTMLTWWRQHGIDRIDLAVRQPSGAMIWHSELAMGSLPLPWARAQNVRRGEVYVRPARHDAWPLVFLDDVATPRAHAIAGKYEALLVKTSPAGGCHVWLACERRLAEASRREAQRWLVQRIGADPRLDLGRASRASGRLQELEARRQLGQRRRRHDTRSPMGPCRGTLDLVVSDGPAIVGHQPLAKAHRHQPFRQGMGLGVRSVGERRLAAAGLRAAARAGLSAPRR